MSKSLMINNQAHEPIYEIVFETAFEKLAEKVKQIGLEGRKVCIVMDSNTSHLYGEMVRKVLEPVSAKVISFQFPAGELHKTLDVVRDIYKELIEAHFDRKDYLAALGGGVVGDITGFAAATYLRGISFIQIPTTLLSQSDSSVGGKTGVDFDGYKNMVGAFCMPKLVYMNVSTLSTMDERDYLSGMGEVVKHGLIRDKKFFDWLKINHEKICVSIGAAAAAYISMKRGYLTKDELQTVLDAFTSFKLPITVTGVDKEAALAATKSDKKMQGNQIRFILLKSLGEAVVDKTVTMDEMREALDFVCQDA